MTIFTLADFNINACLLTHAVSLIVGIFLSTLYVIGSITHRIPLTLTKARVLSLLFFLFAVPARYFKYIEDIFWFALERGVEWALMLAAVVYFCEDVAKNIFVACTLRYDSIARTS